MFLHAPSESHVWANIWLLAEFLVMILSKLVILVIAVIEKGVISTLRHRLSTRKLGYIRSLPWREILSGVFLLLLQADNETNAQRN